MSVNKKNVKYGKIANVVIMIFPDDVEAAKYVEHIKNATLARALQGMRTLEQDPAKLLQKPIIPQKPRPFNPRQVV